MEIIFVILKVIGVLLAILLLLCVALFVVPVRYRVSLAVQGEIEGKAAIHWLLHLLDVRIYYKEKKVTYRLRVFGIPLPLGKGKNGRQKGIKTREKEKNSSGKQGKPEEPAQMDLAEPDGSPKQEYSPEKAGKENAQWQSLPDRAPIQGEDDSPGNGRPSQAEEPNNSRETEKRKKSKEKKKKRKGQANKGFGSKIKTKFNKFKRKGKAVTQNFQQGETAREDRGPSLKGQFTKIKDMVTEETNQAAFFHVLREIRCLVGHYIPGTVSGNLRFSMGNPELTGKALGTLSLLPFWARSRMVIMPDFLSEAFYAKGILYVAGHIRFLHLPVLGIRLLADKNIRKLVKDIRNQLL